MGIGSRVRVPAWRWKLPIPGTWGRVSAKGGGLGLAVKQGFKPGSRPRARDHEATAKVLGVGPPRAESRGVKKNKNKNKK
jgi:hypothetical protein